MTKAGVVYPFGFPSPEEETEVLLRMPPQLTRPLAQTLAVIAADCRAAFAREDLQARFPRGASSTGPRSCRARATGSERATSGRRTAVFLPAPARCTTLNREALRPSQPPSTDDHRQVMPGHDYRPVDYDRLYYRLDLEPGANEADIKHHYRHLAQILHPDKWRHPTAASMRWADEQFKRVKEARELLEAYWSVHHAPPVSRSALSVAQAEQLHAQMQSLLAQRERVRGELDALRAERRQTFDEIRRMKLERDALRGEVAGLRDAAQAREPQPETGPQAVETASRTSGVRDFLFSKFEDPSRGWLLTLSASVFVCVVIFVVAHVVVGLLLAPIARFEAGRWLANLLQWALVAGGVVLAFGWGWAQRTLYRAARAGREHAVALPADEACRRVSAALRHEPHYGADWRIDSYEAAPDETQFALRAVLRFSPGAQSAARSHTVTFHCRARAAGPAQTSLAYDFHAAAPTWWLVPSARVVRDLRKRLDGDLGAPR
ncbi:J domain-containing protein [Paraburkholderia lycopersici]|uniref:DnaJ domain-containing protein n=1 Tax=Paraburkholderia lycopersici TaxID=416944 RepID=A0A1G6TJT4_9BURK|nr:J domain-containing protein [Paraburkholderia lycopersici]SDD29311.1 DnaJ domain-containing protein [Paraburkholderia lycopersici]